MLDGDAPGRGAGPLLAGGAGGKQSAVRQPRASADDDRRRQRVRLHRLDAAPPASTSTVNWSHRFSQFLSLRLRYQFTRLTNDVTPYFANRTNVSGDAGIAGNNQDPVNWGPPRLLFSSGIAGLGSAQAASNQQPHARLAGVEVLLDAAAGTTSRSAATSAAALEHPVAAGRARHASRSPAAPPGSDLADFLLGLPHASSIAFGNADKYLRAPALDAYITDDWRVSPS